MKVSENSTAKEMWEALKIERANVTRLSQEVKKMKEEAVFDRSKIKALELALDDERRSTLDKEALKQRNCRLHNEREDLVQALKTIVKYI